MPNCFCFCFAAFFFLCEIFPQNKLERFSNKRHGRLLANSETKKENIKFWIVNIRNYIFHSFLSWTLLADMPEEGKVVKRGKERKRFVVCCSKQSMSRASRKKPALNNCGNSMIFPPLRSTDISDGLRDLHRITEWCWQQTNCMNWFVRWSALSEVLLYLPCNTLYHIVLVLYYSVLKRSITA